MAFDPVATLSSFADTECSVQFWTPGAVATVFPSLRAAVEFARENGGRWDEVEITVRLPREDIVFATGKSRILINALDK